MISTVKDVKILEPKGPWKSKSGGGLFVLSALPMPEVRNFFSVPKNGTGDFQKNISGLRHYVVINITKGSQGGGEFHKIRQEIVFTLNGAFKWTIEDLSGVRNEYVLPANHGIWIPAHILHFYEALETNGSLLVVANTIFDPDDPDTHDTYPESGFRFENI